jgi:diguanylate cyclase (GGDEF)-like protein
MQARAMNAQPSRSSTLIESLTRAQLLVYVAAILLASFGASLVGYRYLHQQMRRHLDNLAQITAIECEPALIFDQDAAAADVLRAIPAEEGITRAELFDVRGKLRASSAAAPQGLVGRIASYLDGEHATTKVVADGHVIGQVRLQGGQQPLLHAVFGLIASDLLVLAIVGVLSVAVSRRNTRRITQPLTQLRTLMRCAIEQRDFTQRAPSADIAEVEDLRSEFNTLLDEIVHRDRTLRAHNSLLRRLAFHDALTGLPNRAMFERALLETLNECKLTQARAALLYLDIDSFKAVNDTFGHAGGDGLLIETAKRLQDWLPDGAIAARLGGDEFVVLISPWPHHEQLPNVGSDIVAGLQAVLEQPALIGTHRIEPGVSIGLALYPDDAGDTNTLLQLADKAMYRVKATHYAAAMVTRWTSEPTFAPDSGSH